jgi:hypothetical protein
MSDAPPWIHDPPRWSRLLLDGAPVGFIREVGGTTLYSSDGYGWSGTPIEFDTRVPDTRLRDVTRGRIYHGDVVRMALSEQRPTLVEVIVLEHPEHGTLIWQPRHDRVHALDHLWPPPLRPKTLHRVGHVTERPQDAALVPAVLDAWRPLDPNARINSTWLALSSVGGGLASVGLQLMVLDAVGPIGTWLGAQIATLAFFWTQRATRPSRATMLGAAAWGALKAGALSTGLAGLAMALGWLTVKHPIPTLVVLAIASTLGAGIAHVLGGDLIVWRGGGYSGEGQIRRK